MVKFGALVALSIAAATSTSATAATYVYVGSWHVGDGPDFRDNPPTYTGQEAAVLLFGGVAGDYAISTIDNQVSDINHMAFRRPPSEVINDLSGDVATLFRVLQEHYPYFVDMLRWRLTSRAEFDRLRALPADRLTDLQRAARFLYLQRLAFGGKVAGRSFGVDRRTPGRFDVTKLEPMLADIHERLAGVVIEALPYADLIRRYDGPDVLFYLDPPYVGCEDDYGDGFAPGDFARMAEQLGGITGKFVLSINDTPLARDVFGRFQIEAAPVTYTIGTSHGAGQRAGELIITAVA